MSSFSSFCSVIFQKPNLTIQFKLLLQDEQQFFYLHIIAIEEGLKVMLSHGWRMASALTGTLVLLRRKYL
jgi:hypothetical protein